MTKELHDSLEKGKFTKLCVHYLPLTLNEALVFVVLLIYKWEGGGEGVLTLNWNAKVLFLPPCINTCALCLDKYCQQTHNIK